MLCKYSLLAVAKTHGKGGVRSTSPARRGGQQEGLVGLEIESTGLLPCHTGTGILFKVKT